ncbi:MAG: Uma2 family endonuclease, partial [Myxococcales bacterium]|nr:Uma2 family endonuclease [Myxococcales bacterium]
MARVHIDGLTIPPIDGLSEFRTWIGSLGEEAPRAAFVDGEVFVEMAPQTFDIHQPLVDEINSTLRYLATDLDLGRYFFPPSWITHASAGLSNEPDGFLVRWQSFESGRVQVAPERRSELMGAPDFAFEAVSPSSASK